jgi:protein-L-isoaspartate(D-aspartate) O-methyltransferase
MVRVQMENRDITSSRVLDVMRKVPRHRFVPQELAGQAYEDHPLPIGFDQTISQPYIVASMTQALDVQPGDRVLEIGTGSGYQAAVLAELAAEVYTIEIVRPLGLRAEKTLGELGYKNVFVRVGDGYAGWPEKAPFDKIMLTAAPPKVPEPLFDQLKEGGLLIAPVGVYGQDLVLYRKMPEGLVERDLYPVRFVPMTGKAQE